MLASTSSEPARSTRSDMFERALSSRYWFLQAILALEWIGVWHLAGLLGQTPASSLWFPAAGMTFALFLAEGVAAVPAVVIGVAVTNFQWAALYGDSRGAAAILLTGLAFCAAHGLAYGLGAALFARIDGEDRFASPMSVVGFLCVATAASLLAAVAGIGSLIVTGAPGVRFATDLVPWWIGDLVGVVTLAPFFLLVVDRTARTVGLPSSGWSASLRRLGPGDARIAGFVAKLAISVAVVAVFGIATTLGGLGVPVLLAVFVVAVPLMWIAHTEGGLRTVVAVAVLATAVVAVTRLLGTVEEAFNYQAAMVAIAGVGLFNLTVPRLYADNRRLLDRLTYDQLTGARTRTAFYAAAEDLLERRRRAPTEIAVVVFDVDHFKTINDRFGHATGDAVLATIGEICRRELRGLDLFGRIGGEEFAVLLPDTGVATAVEVAERLRSLFSAARWGRSGGLAATASFGVAGVAVDEPLAAALDRADRAMYEAKRRGRNRVRRA